MSIGADASMRVRREPRARTRREDGERCESARAVVTDRTRSGPAVEPIHVDDPGPGEVRVRIVANGVCHSDRWAIEHGNWGAPFPMLLGHEGAGVVDAVGPGVDARHTGTAGGARLGRAVRDVPRMPARDCRGGVPTSGTSRRASASRGPASRSTGRCRSDRSRRTRSCTPRRWCRCRSASTSSRACLLGCGVSTGVGAAVNTAGVDAGRDRRSDRARRDRSRRLCRARRIAGASTADRGRPA